MKQRYTILFTLTLFGITLYFAFFQGVMESMAGQSESWLLSKMNPSTPAAIPAFFAARFNELMSGLTSLFGGSIVVSLIVLALMVELVLVYPHILTQLKQKIIHLFHKKLVNRFEAGELSFSKINREMDVLYSVNQQLHLQGALLVLIQLIVFLVVFWGLQSFALSGSARSLIDSTLLFRPTNVLIPLFTALTYFSQALIKISIKQKEDHIHPKQVQLALLIAIVSSSVIYIGSTLFSVLLSIYFVSLISLGTVRYLLVDNHAKKWSKNASKKLIQLLKKAHSKPSSIKKMTQKWHHQKVVRHVNFHLLEEAMSMSFVFMIIMYLN